MHPSNNLNHRNLNKSKFRPKGWNHRLCSTKEYNMCQCWTTRHQTRHWHMQLCWLLCLVLCLCFTYHIT